MWMIIRHISLLITLVILSNHWKKRSGCLKNNLGEFHLRISGNEYSEYNENSDYEKLFGGNIPDTWKKSSWTLNVLVRLEPFIGFINVQDH